MEVKYRRELNETYMILGEDAPQEEFALKILQENKPEGLMRMTVRQMDGIPQYYFEISRGNSLARMLAKRQISFEEIRQLILSLARTVEQMEAYLLDVDHLILEPEFIYGVPDFSRIVFCCHPAYQRDFFGQLRELIQYFLNKIDHLEGKSVETAYELFSISQQDNFCFEDLLEVVGREAWQIEERRQDAGEAREEGESAPPEELWDFPAAPYEEKKRSGGDGFPWSGVFLCAASGGFAGYGLWWKAGNGAWDWRYAAGALLLFLSSAICFVSFLRRKRKGLPGESESEAQQGGPRGEERAHTQDGREIPRETRGEEEAPETGAVTEFLAGSFQRLPRERVLISENSLRYETIRMAKMPFVIGKLESAADYTMKRPTISRIHARIEQQNGNFFLTDCNSTNGTYINGIRLEANRRYPLREGDEVELADLKYIFQ